jgi:hypothetical protein
VSQASAVRLKQFLVLQNKPGANAKVGIDQAARARTHTVAEAGFPGFDATFSLPLCAARGNPPATVQAALTQIDPVPILDSPSDSALRLVVDSDNCGAVARRIHLWLE